MPGIVVKRLDVDVFCPKIMGMAKNGNGEDGVSEIGRRVREWRLFRRLSQEALSKAIGVSPSYIYQLETGNCKTPSFIVGMRLAEALKIKPQDLLRTAQAGEEAAAE